MGNILVTGGNGFVGQALIKSLTNCCNTTVLYPSSKELNLMMQDDVQRYFENHEIHTVIHLAACLGGVGLVTEKPLFFLESNLLINYNVVVAAETHGVSKFITLGSSCCYNNDLSIPMNEDDLWKKQPENSYGLCKLVLLEHLKLQKSMQWVYLIPPNLYGPEDHFGKADSHLIPATVDKFKMASREGKESITVWGDGSQIRDFVYVDDLVKILCESLMSSIYDGAPINVATNKGVSVREIVCMICELMKMEHINIVWDKTKPTGTMKKVLDNNNLLSINPQVYFVDIQEGLKNTIAWYINSEKKDG